MPRQRRFFSELPIFVVEEHGEAMPHWRDSAIRDGFVVHIDAHPDMAVPRAVEGLRFGMESNDEFIFAAAFEGIINRTVWIWPSWDSRGSRHGEVGDEDGPETSPWLQVVVLGHQTDGETCVCNGAKVLLNGTVDWTSALEYSRNNLQECQSSQDNIVEDCRGNRSMAILQTSETHLDDIMPWLPKFLHGRGIFDVDEDHFAQQANKDRLRFLSKGSLRSLVAQFSCPELGAGQNSSDIEMQLDAELRSYVNKARQCKEEMRGSCNIAEEVPRFLSSSACPSKNQRPPSVIVAALWKRLLDCTALELELLQLYGFCFNTSPIPGVDNGAKLMVCSEGERESVNLDTDAQRAELVLSEEPATIARRLGLFHQILRRLQPIAPDFSIVTLCRSVRDGYTPRRVWEAIESNVLKALGGPITFGKSLLGGPRGWSAWTERGIPEVVLV
jgi:hypothetical protein